LLLTDYQNISDSLVAGEPPPPLPDDSETVEIDTGNPPALPNDNDIPGFPS
jgi:hypothetical protein